MNSKEQRKRKKKIKVDTLSMNKLIKLVTLV